MFLYNLFAYFHVPNNLAGATSLSIRLRIFGDSSSEIEQILWVPTINQTSLENVSGQSAHDIWKFVVPEGNRTTVLRYFTFLRREEGLRYIFVFATYFALYKLTICCNMDVSLNYKITTTLWSQHHDNVTEIKISRHCSVTEKLKDLSSGRDGSSINGRDLSGSPALKGQHFSFLLIFPKCLFYLT
jgi:hypothetical protein